MIVVPTKAIYQGTYVYVVNDGKLLRKEVTTRWQNSQDAVIESGLNNGDELVITPLGQVSSGTPVTVLGAPSKVKQSESKPDLPTKPSAKEEQPR